LSSKCDIVARGRPYASNAPDVAHRTGRSNENPPSIARTRAICVCAGPDQRRHRRPAPISRLHHL